MTLGSRRTTSGGPSAIFWPWSSTTTRCEMSMTTSMLCSTSSTVLPARCSARICAYICSIMVVDRGGRLVQQQQLGVGHQRRREGQQLPLAVGERARRRASPRAQPHRLEQAPRPLHRGRLQPAHPRRPHQASHEAFLLVLLEERQQVLQGGEPREHAHQLEGASDAEPRDPMRGGAGHVLAAEEHPAAVGRQIAGHAVEQRGLAGAVGADQAHELARLHREVDRVHRGDPEEALGEAARLEERHVRPPPAAARARRAAAAGPRARRGRGSRSPAAGGRRSPCATWAPSAAPRAAR